MFNFNKNLIDRKKYIIPNQKDYIYKLDINENILGHCPQLNDLIIKDLHKYPNEDISKLIHLINDYTNTSPNQIILTNGSDNALKLILEGFCIPTSNMLIPIPSYPHFISMAENMYHNKIIYCDINELFNMINNEIDLVYLASPNMPMGYLFDIDILKELLIKYPNTIFILDEAYYEFGNNISGISLINEFNNLIVTRTFSKCFGLAGCRIGYLITNPKIVDLLNIINNDKNVIDISIRAAIIVLQNKQFYENQVIEVNRIKEYLRNELNDICNDESEIYDYSMKYGNFFLIYCKNTKKVCKIFEDHKVYIRDKYNDIKNGIRITVGHYESMKCVINILKMINIKHLIQIKSIGFDLDGTLRRDSKDDTFYDLSIINNNPYIITNNACFSINYLKDLLKDNGLITNKIITPRSTFEKLNDENSFFVYSIDMNKDNIIRICNNLSQGKTLYYSDDSEYCTFDTCSEIIQTGNTKMPDLKTFIKCFDGLGDIKLIGKPSLFMNPQNIEIFIGDSNTDMNFAKNIDALFIRVGCNKIFYDIENQEIQVPDITYLY